MFKGIWNEGLLQPIKPKSKSSRSIFRDSLKTLQKFAEEEKKLKAT